MSVKSEGAIRGMKPVRKYDFNRNKAIFENRGSKYPKGFKKNRYNSHVIEHRIYLDDEEYARFICAARHFAGVRCMSEKLVMEGVNKLIEEKNEEHVVQEILRQAEQRVKQQIAFTEIAAR